VTPKYQVQSSTPYSSLAKYKVDRAKQQQLQQLIQQQQQVQQLIQQQQKLAQQLATPDPGIQAPQFRQRQYQQQRQQYSNSQYGQNGFQNLHQDLSHPLFSDQQLQDYLEKQRELELLQKQRQQLLYEQQELRRQQEALRLQQLQKLTSTASPIVLPTAVSPTSIAVSTTSTPLLLPSPTARRITPSETDLFLRAIANHQKKYTTTVRSTTARSTTTTTTTTPPPLPPPPSRRPVDHRVEEISEEIPENLLSLIQDQEDRLLQQGKAKPQIKVIYQTEKPATSRQSTSSKNRSSQQSERELLLKQLKLALAQSSDDDNARNVSTRDLILPNGKKLQVIHAPSGLSSIVPSTANTVLQTSPSSTTTIKPPRAIFEELTKGGVLPPGADFEIIRQKSDGKLEEIGKTPAIQNLPAKKVTFVVLEEQLDGSYKVQGVKGNDKESGTDVESIVERIKKGELKLPPSSHRSTTQPPTLVRFESSIDPNLVLSSGTSKVPVSSFGSTVTTFRPTTARSASTRYNEG